MLTARYINLATVGYDVRISSMRFLRVGSRSLRTLLCLKTLHVEVRSG
jgi:hypothetical protein